MVDGVEYEYHVLKSEEVEIKSADIAHAIKSRIDSGKEGFSLRADFKIERWYISYTKSFDCAMRIAMVLIDNSDSSIGNKFLALACLNHAVRLNPKDIDAQDLRGVIAREIGFRDYMSSSEHLAA
jgi:hypothetical protein